MAAVSCPFCLTQKDQKVKADINGLPHLATAPQPCRPLLTDHGDEIKDFNIDPIDFILMIMNFGKLNTEGKNNRIYLEGQEFRLIVTTEWFGKTKQLLLTAFDLRPVSRKNPQRAKEMKKAPKR